MKKIVLTLISLLLSTSYISAIGDNHFTAGNTTDGGIKVEWDGDLIPLKSSSDLGTTTNPWDEINVSGLSVSGDISVSGIVASTVTASSMTITDMSGTNATLSQVDSSTVSTIALSITPTDVTTSYTISGESIIISSAASETTLTLPSASDLTGKMLFIHNKSTQNLIIESVGSELINATDTIKLKNNNSTFQLISDGSNWFQIGTQDYPRQTAIFHYNAHVDSGNDMAIVVSTSNIFNQLAYQDLPVANGNSCHHHVTLSEGYYTLELWGQKGDNRGIVDIYLDDVIVVNQSDWYNGQIENYNESSTIYVPYNGTHEFKIVVNGKNASSSDYVAVYSAFFFRSNDD